MLKIIEEIVNLTEEAITKAHKEEENAYWRRLHNEMINVLQDYEREKK